MDIEAGVTGVGTIMEAVMTTTISVVITASIIGLTPVTPTPVSTAATRKKQNGQFSKALIIKFCFSFLVAAVDIEAGVTGVGTIMEAVMTTTIAVVMVGTEATEVETTVILIKAAPMDPVGTTTITTEDVEAVAEAGGVAAVATMEVNFREFFFKKSNIIGKVN